MRARSMTTLAVAVTVLAGPAILHAAEPASGSIKKKKDTAAWTGGPFLVPNPAACVGSFDPTCDHFTLTVEARIGKHVGVGITTEFPDSDDFDLAVYDANGTLLASSAGATGTEGLVFEHTGNGPYEVRVQPWLVTPGATYEGVAALSRDPVDVERECLQPVPESVSVDFLDNVSLDVVVLVDGPTTARAQDVMTQAAASYLPLNVSLNWELETVSFTTDDAQGLIDAAKARFGGERPDGADLVYVMTTKDIQLGGDTGVAGLADCIGGVRYPDTAFAVGEDFGAESDAGIPLGPFVHTTQGSAVVAAHELGHLMGAHHHYGNCVQGVSVEDAQNLELTPCTLMFNFVNFASLPFSTVNTTVVRGHTLDYATP